MAGRILVSIGTDGLTDWVRTPDGARYNLGPVSVLSFVASMVPKAQAKKVLDSFALGKEAMLSVDEELMWEMLAPRRARWSALRNPLLTLQSQESTMSTLSDDLAAVENHIQALKTAAAKKATNLTSGVEVLVKLAGKIKSPNQSKNNTYYNLGAPDVHEVGDKVAGLSYDTYAQNSETANQILAKAEVTVQTIDKLAAAGRKFNASRAKADVRSVTSKVAGILQVDLTAPWVAGDLAKLAARMDEVHGLFAKAKV